MNEPCPCGSGLDFTACCGPLLAGQQVAETALALMRSRYTAYVRGATDYLLATWHSRTRPNPLQLGQAPQWQGLQLLSSVRGGSEDEVGWVEFIAHYRSPAGPGRLHECSHFIREHGHWRYVEGVTAPPKGAKPGRNSPCPCGSGRKYKHCCATRGAPPGV